MKNFLFVLCILIGVPAIAQSFTVTIPTDQLPETAVSYCILSGDEGQIIDEYFYNPFTELITDTIRLQSYSEDRSHLSVVHYYAPVRADQEDLTRVFTCYGLETDFLYQAEVRPREMHVLGQYASSEEVVYHFTDMDYSLSQVQFPPKAELTDKGYRSRHRTGKLEGVDQCAEDYYIFLRQGSKTPWRYILHQQEFSGDTIRYSGLPTISREKRIVLPVFGKWQLQVTAYHPYLDDRVSIPFSDSRDGRFEGRELYLQIPEDDILEDFIIRALVSPQGDKYLYLFRGNNLPDEIYRVEPSLSPLNDARRISIKMVSPDGYFLLESPSNRLVRNVEGGFEYEDIRFSWVLTGEIPPSRHIEFDIPVFRSNMLHAIPTLKRFTARQMTVCKLFYPNVKLTPQQWSTQLVQGQYFLQEFGGMMFTDNLPISIR
ncbi:hypothetical protein [Lewinella cohaerens]|uniref:hypothetical protein n=1 Tax=Lewinella cohaerens TaxID=70995 RepID=UPI00036BFAB7|nr:hypothetical protein [Lewinella cohaerens]